MVLFWNYYNCKTRRQQISTCDQVYRSQHGINWDTLLAANRCRGGCEGQPLIIRRQYWLHCRRVNHAWQHMYAASAHWVNVMIICPSLHFPGIYLSGLMENYLAQSKKTVCDWVTDADLLLYWMRPSSCDGHVLVPCCIIILTIYIT